MREKLEFCQGEMFSLVFVGLFVWEQDSRRKNERISGKLVGVVDTGQERIYSLEIDFG